MNIYKMRDLVIVGITAKRDDVSHKFDREKEELRVERKDNGKGITIALAKALNKAKNDDKIIDELVYYIDESLERMGEENIDAATAAIYPVVRAASFPKETKGGEPFIITPHTNETNIYYAVDFDKSYRLIDEALLESLGMSEEDMKVLAENNLQNLPVEIKKQTVQENDFYFINHNDGYDSSRILNTAFLHEMLGQTEGEMLVGLPHQDVLIIADCKNNVGYDIMAQMMMQYFTEGLTPITSLSFSYDGTKLQPVFILGKQKNYNKKTNSEESSE